MNSLTPMLKHNEYKDSGISWLGSIPSHWEGVPLCSVSKLKSITNHVDEPLLSVYLDKGVIRFDEVEAKRTNVTSLDLSKYQLVEPGNFVLNNQQAWRGSVGVSAHRGIVSPAYLVLQLSSKIYPRFGNYLFRDGSMVANYLVNSKGVGTIQRNLYWPQLKRALVFFPGLDEQIAIANFLDEKTSQIDEAISIKQKQIELLKERKQIIIQQAVTQGLNPNVPMKDSGVDWIGTIPEHWSVKRAKYLLDEINERSETGLEELLSVSHMTGVTPRSEKNVTMFMAEDYTGSKLCHSGDLVINIMWAWMGALGVSDRTGIVSPSYGVFREQREGTFVPKYLEMLLKSTKYVEYYNKVSTGLHSSRLRFYGHMLFDMAMGFPPYEEQTQIVDYISRECSKVDETITVQAEQVSKLKEYKTTLINSAVTGKIKVTEQV
ncbi:restriction endonuclease subunit S [Vibrio sp. PID23_8]|uniref:restriction endonuclease subunit S n=1 Tax=Vibrio sp. PID23_8 TaxID=1583767 RepID=UPI000E68E3BC|nr:restriction endonuclease subunit S [Vibrio sp. PID23_8]RIZ51536.1 restriction endonuclease subunit S [Vibrio sp. PID23_8]